MNTEITYQQFRAEHPEVPESSEIACINLTMKKEFALQILRGEKKVEFRAFNDYWYSRLYDKNVINYLEEHADDEVVKEFGESFIDPNRKVRKMRFRNQSNTWFLEVECVSNGDIMVCEPDVEFLQEEFGCHELDEMLAGLEATKAERRPMFFYFEIGKVIDTNLQV